MSWQIAVLIVMNTMTLWVQPCCGLHQLLWLCKKHIARCNAKYDVNHMSDCKRKLAIVTKYPLQKEGQLWCYSLMQFKFDKHMTINFFLIFRCWKQDWPSPWQLFHELKNDVADPCNKQQIVLLYSIVNVLGFMQTDDKLYNNQSHKWNWWIVFSLHLILYVTIGLYYSFPPFSEQK